MEFVAVSDRPGFECVCVPYIENNVTIAKYIFIKNVGTRAVHVCPILDCEFCRQHVGNTHIARFINDLRGMNKTMQTFYFLLRKQLHSHTRWHAHAPQPTNWISLWAKSTYTYPFIITQSSRLQEIWIMMDYLHARLQRHVKSAGVHLCWPFLFVARISSLQNVTDINILGNSLLCVWRQTSYYSHSEICMASI